MARNTRTKTLVTGGTGFLGKHLLQQLLETPAAGQEVRLLTRKPPKGAKKRDIEIVEGSVLDGDVVRAAVKDCGTIYHFAGFVSRRRDDAAEMYRVHVDGTRVLLEAAAQAGVRRVVVASTSGTIGVSQEPEAVATEADPHPMELLRTWPYYLSKVYQEQMAFDLGEKLDIEIVCINPTLVLGPGDSRLSSTDDVLKYLKGEIPVCPDGGISFVDARDAATAAIAAMSKGRPGHRYLLGAANWTFEKFCRKLEQISGVLAPRIKVPRRWAEIGLDLMGAVTRLTGKEFDDTVSAEMAQRFWYIDSTKAVNELGFAPRDPEQTLIDTVRYLRKKFLSDVDPVAATP